jgi:hypothetical protein
MMDHRGFWYNRLVGSFPYLDHMVVVYKKGRRGFWYNQVYMMDHLELSCNPLAM